MSNVEALPRRSLLTLPAHEALGGTIVQLQHPDLYELLILARNQGRCLTYDQVNDYLPDEGVGPEKINALLLALDRYRIRMVEELPNEENFEDPVRELPADANPAVSCRPKNCPSSATIRFACT